MLCKRATLYLVILFLLMPSFAFSIDDIKDYTVVEGDTLWDISGNELKDPFLWPKIWKENPELQNPDRIYPDQSIRIPLYLIQPQKKEEPLIAAPPPEPEIELLPEPEPSFLVNKNVLIASGYISKELPGVGKITGSPIGKNLFGNFDEIYVETTDPVNIGDKFYIKRTVRKVKHPATNKFLGYLVEIVGIAEIKKFQFGDTIATVIHNFGPIITGNFLDTYHDVEVPLASESYRKPNIDGYILSSTLLRTHNSALDIVYIDKGFLDGIMVGDMLRTVVDGEHKIPNGVIQVISSRDKTSTAIVLRSTDPVTEGNLITAIE